MLTFLLAVCQEGRIKHGCTWRILRFPNQTFRTGLVLISWMTSVDLKEETQKLLSWYLYWMCFKKGRLLKGVLGRTWWFLIKDLEDSVLLNDLKKDQKVYFSPLFLSFEILEYSEANLIGLKDKFRPLRVFFQSSITCFFYSTLYSGIYESIKVNLNFGGQYS